MKTLFLKLAAASCLLSTGGCFAAGAVSVERKVTVDNSPTTVWKLMGNFNALDVWHPAIVKSELKGTGAGTGEWRLLTLENGATILEKLLSYSATEKSYSYLILKSPLPVANYQGSITLAPAEEGQTVVKWSSTFDAVGVSDEQAAKIIGGIYEAGLAKLAANFKPQ